MPLYSPCTAFPASYALVSYSLPSYALVSYSLPSYALVSYSLSSYAFVNYFLPSYTLVSYSLPTCVLVQLFHDQLCPCKLLPAQLCLCKLFPAKLGPCTAIPWPDMPLDSLFLLSYAHKIFVGKSSKEQKKNKMQGLKLTSNQTFQCRNASGAFALSLCLSLALVKI